MAPTQQSQSHPTPQQSQQQHGHSHGSGQTCNHNHGPESDENDDFDHTPTKIPYYIVVFIIFSVYIGFLATQFIFETRPMILNQGRAGIPYEYPEFIMTHITNNKVAKVVAVILNFTPFTLHPLSWITFTFISICFFLSFFRVTYTDPGSVDPMDPIWGFHKHPQQTQLAVQHQLAQYHQPSILPPTTERKHNGSRRYCRKLNLFKPDRAHYCHATNRLIKRLDHHCIFVKASVGYNNHKYFILFLFWLIVLGTFIGTKIIIPMHFVWGIHNMSHLLINVVVGCFGAATALALSAFLGFHLWLIANSLTTLETGEKYNKWDIFTGSYRTSPFNVSFTPNFQQVFGRGPIWSWFFPIHPTRSPDDDGTIYAISHQCPPNTLHNQ